MGIELPGDKPIQSSASGTDSPSEEITILESRRDFSDEKILELINKDARHANKDHTKILRKLRKYFDSVISSQGFECRYYPGPITDLTTIEPKQHLIDMMDDHPEGINRMYLLTNLALHCYNNDAGTKLRVMRLLTINAMKGTGRSFTYYITFIAWNVNTCEERTLQAKVQDEVFDMDVIFCRRKQND